MLGQLRRRRRTRPVTMVMMTMKNQKHGSVNFLWVWGSAQGPFGLLGAPLKIPLVFFTHIVCSHFIYSMH